MGREKFIFLNLHERQSMTDTQSWLQNRSAAVLCMALLLIAVLAWQPTITVAAQAGFESAVVLSASKILPPELLSGPNHRVQDKVTNDGFLNIYVVDSKFGSFRAVSTPLLRKRIQEINAMGTMEKLKGTKEFADSLKASGLTTFSAAKNMVLSPVKTATEVVTGVGLVFRRAGDSLFGAKRSDAEDSRFKTLIGFSNYKREYAYELGVDVYSRNEALQDRLNDVSWTAFAGGLTVSAAMAAVPGGAGIAMTAISSTRLATAIFKNTPPQDLRRINTEKLTAMGVDPSTTELFISQSIFSPREQTVLVSGLDEMKGVADRERFVQLAALTNNADMAFFRQRQAEMYAGYHKGVAPLVQFVSVGQLAAARTKSGALVFNVPVDYMIWTESLAQLAANTDNLAKQLPGLTEKQLWVTGMLSRRARAEMQRMNWKIYEGAEALVVAQDKPYPTYTKENPQTPAATVKLKSRSVALGAGVSWGDGTIAFQGKEYPITLSGLSLLDLGVSSVSATGKVYSMNKLSDLSGNYIASQATFAVAGGSGELTMINDKGVVITLASEQSGTQLTAGPAGMSIKLK